MIQRQEGQAMLTGAGEWPVQKSFVDVNESICECFNLRLQADITLFVISKNYFLT